MDTRDEMTWTRKRVLSEIGSTLRDLGSTHRAQKEKRLQTERAAWTQRAACKEGPQQKHWRNVDIGRGNATAYCLVFYFVLGEETPKETRGTRLTPQAPQHLVISS